MIYLETERLILRDYTENDAEEYSRLMADDQVMYYLRDIQHHSREESEEDFRNILLDMREKDRQRYFLHIQKRIQENRLEALVIRSRIQLRQENWCIWDILHIRNTGAAVM